MKLIPILGATALALTLSGAAFAAEQTRQNPAGNLPEAVQAGELALWHMFAAAPGPTMIVRGAQSDLLLRETVAEMVARGKQVSTVEIPDVGHAPTFIDPAQIAIARNFFLGT